MVTVCGPIVTVPVRAAVPVCAATVSVSVPEPSPLALAGSVIHATGLTPVHAQPVGASIATVTSPPFAETAVFAGMTL